MSHESPPADDWNRHWRDFANATELNPAQAFRRTLVEQALELERAPRPARLLEIGSGSGDLSRELVTRYPRLELAGLELSRSGVELARKKVPGAEFFERDLTRPLELPERYLGWATHAVCSEVLEHLDDPQVVLDNVRDYLAPGARLVITVPAGPISAFDRHIGHRAHFSRERLERLLADAGFELGSVDGAGFPFFNLYRLLVVARGRKLIDDAGAGDLPPAARAAMHSFSWLFRLSAKRGRLGWQLVAVAHAPTTQGASTGRNG